MSANVKTTRRDFISRSLSSAALLGTSSLVSGLHAAKNRSGNDSKNVILIFIDDLGYGDISALGCKDIPTPHIDRLAKEGVLCTSSYITNPPCCPSRSSLMMGMHGAHFGKYGMSRGVPIPDDKPTMAKFMSAQGYVTGQIGKWDLGSAKQGPLAVGFNEVARVPPKKKYTPDELTALQKRTHATDTVMKNIKNGSKYICINKDKKEQWLTDYDGDNVVDFIERHKEEPFFMYWSPQAIHSFNTECPESLQQRTTATGNRRRLAGAIVSVDDQVGKIVKALEKHNLRENTLIIFASDNGADLKEGGSSAPYAGGKGVGTQKEGWVRTPAIFSLPGVIPQGFTYNGLMCSLDFYPTMAALTGAPAPEHCDGKNLLPIFKSKKQTDAHEYIYWRNDDPTDEKRRHVLAVRWKNWRLYRYEATDPWQLFDLEKDPKEENNVAEKHPDVAKHLAEKWDEWCTGHTPLIPTPPRTGRDESVFPSNGHGWDIGGCIVG